MVTKTLNKLLLMMVIVMTTISVFADPGASGSQNTQGNGQAVFYYSTKHPEQSVCLQEHFLRSYTQMDF